jgi:6-pyruvoyltetrahydropterin/6-carboxytetrahydropterin synthase
MYYATKTLEISASHSVELAGGECEAPHGHNYIITVFCRSEKLDTVGMVVDFNRIKEIVHGRLDHTNLNDVLPFNPTAENIARWVVDNVPKCFKAVVRETRNNEAAYEK